MKKEGTTVKVHLNGGTKTQQLAAAQVIISHATGKSTELGSQAGVANETPTYGNTPEFIAGFQATNSVSPESASIVAGFTPAGLGADLYTAATGEDFFTESEVSGFWRWAGLIPGVSEARKLGKAGEEAITVIRKGDDLPLTSPTYAELKGLNKGFQAHHILPQYLGKMLGFTKKDMLNHPATSVTQFSHTGKSNSNAMHKAISRYLPPMVGGKKANYSANQIRAGLQSAYTDIGRPELFNSVSHLIK